MSFPETTDHIWRNKNYENPAVRAQPSALDGRDEHFIPLHFITVKLWKQLTGLPCMMDGWNQVQVKSGMFSYPKIERSKCNHSLYCTIQNFKHHISNSWSYHWTKSVLIWSYHVLLPQTWLLHQELEFALWPLEQEVRPMANMNPLIALINYLW